MKKLVKWVMFGLGWILLAVDVFIDAWGYISLLSWVGLVSLYISTIWIFLFSDNDVHNRGGNGE